MDLFELNGRVVVNLTDAVKAFNEIQNEGQKTESKLGKFFSGVGKTAAAAGKAIATGLAAGATAMAGLTVKALQLGGELEQNMGGAEAVFGDLGDSIDKISTTIITGYDEATGKAIKSTISLEEASKNAYKNMGLSTSDYLATANKMGALFQGSGFKTQEALDLTSSAMQRAADVASIMGIDTSAAMEAIAGAAKGNFTMLDNLGVAMNDTTLQAYALEKGIKKSTGEMTNQEKIGLAMEMFMEKTAYAAGNYAKENETLAGSLGTAKSALTNFLDGSGNVEDVVSSVSNLANVVVRSLSEILPRLTTGLQELVQQIVPLIPPLIDQLLPALVDGAYSLLDGLVAVLPQILSTLMDTAIGLLYDITSLITESIMPALVDIFGVLVAALPELLPTLVECLVDIIMALMGYLPDLIQPIIDNLPQIFTLLIDALLGNLPRLILGLIELTLAIVDALPQIIIALINALPVVATMIVDAIVRSLPLFIQGLIQLVTGLVQALPQIFAALVTAIPAIFKTIWNGIKTVFAPVGEWFKNLWNSLKSNPALSSLCTTIENLWKAAKNNISTIINAIKSVISTVWNAIKNNVSTVVNSIKDVITTVWNSIKNVVSTVINSVKNVINTVWNAIKTIIANVMNIIFSVIKGDWTSVKNSISNILNAVKSVISSVWNGIKSVISSVMSGIKSTISSVWNGIKNTVSSVVNGIKSTISSVFNGIKSVTASVWNGIKTSITKPIETAKNTIKGIVDKIKGFFTGMKIQFPNIKLPHFSIKPSGWKIGDLLKGSIPTLGIDWYAKAMNNPMLMTDPTVFGYDAATGRAKVGGEAGDEIVGGASTIMNMIRAAVADQNSAIAYYLQKLIDILASYFPQVLEAMDRDVVLDSGAMVGAMVVPMNKALGKLSDRKDRGR